MDRHLAAVAAYVQRRVAHQVDAEEVVADVFVRAWRHAEARPDGAEAERAWLLAIARHRVIDHYRRDDARTRMRQRLAARSTPHVEDGPNREATRRWRKPWLACPTRIVSYSGWSPGSSCRMPTSRPSSGAPLRTWPCVSIDLEPGSARTSMTSKLTTPPA